MVSVTRISKIVGVSEEEIIKRASKVHQVMYTIYNKLKDIAEKEFLDIVGSTKRQ